MMDAIDVSKQWGSLRDYRFARGSIGGDANGGSKWDGGIFQGFSRAARTCAVRARAASMAAREHALGKTITYGARDHLLRGRREAGTCAGTSGDGCFLPGT